MRLEKIFKSRLKYFLFFFLGFFLSLTLPPYNYIFLGFIIFPFILYLLKLNEQQNPRFFFIYGPYSLLDILFHRYTGLAIL